MNYPAVMFLKAVKRTWTFSHIVFHVPFSHLSINAPESRNGCNKFERTNRYNNEVTGTELTSNPYFIYIKKEEMLIYSSTPFIYVA